MRTGLVCQEALAGATMQPEPNSTAHILSTSQGKLGDESDEASGGTQIDERGAAVLIQLIADRILNGIDETLASFYALQQEPPERVVQLRQAMCDMLMTVGGHARFKEEVVQQSIAQLLETLTLLRDIIHRAKVSCSVVATERGLFILHIYFVSLRHVLYQYR